MHRGPFFSVTLKKLPKQNNATHCISKSASAILLRTCVQSVCHCLLSLGKILGIASQAHCGRNGERGSNGARGRLWAREIETRAFEHIHTYTPGPLGAHPHFAKWATHKTQKTLDPTKRKEEPPAVRIGRPMALVGACRTRANLIDLPDDVIIAIASWLRLWDLVALGQTAQRLRDLCSASCLWRPVLGVCPDDAFSIPETDITLYLMLSNDHELMSKGLKVINRGALGALGRALKSTQWIDANARLTSLCGAKHARACRVKARWRFGEPPAAVAHGTTSCVDVSSWLWTWCSGEDAVNLEMHRGAVDAATGHLHGIGLCFSVSLRRGDLTVRGVLGTWHDGLLLEQIAAWPADPNTRVP